jgi:hypothetical protein
MCRLTSTGIDLIAAHNVYGTTALHYKVLDTRYRHLKVAWLFVRMGTREGGNVAEVAMIYGSGGNAGNCRDGFPREQAPRSIADSHPSCTVHTYEQEMSVLSFHATLSWFISSESFEQTSGH